MKRLIKDLAAWETGQLSLPDVEARHPREHVRSLVSLHERLASVGRQSAPPPAGAWETLRSRLPDKGRAVPWRVRRVRLAVATGLAAAALGALAYAAGPDAVRSGVASAVERVTEFFTEEDESKPPSSPAPSPVPSAAVGSVPSEEEKEEKVPPPSPSPVAHEGQGKGTPAPTPDGGNEEEGELETPHPTELETPQPTDQPVEEEDTGDDGPDTSPTPVATEEP